MSLTLYAAVDVAAGKASQVAPGHTNDPLAVALGFVHAGAAWLHMVDLDQAFRRGNNLDLLGDLIAAVPVPVQLSGGIDSIETLHAAASTGAQRINLASTALLGDDQRLNFDFIASAVAEHRARVAIGLDVRPGADAPAGIDGGGRVVVARGTNVEVGSVDRVVESLAGTGATEFVVADASRDGSRRGVDVAMFGSVSAALRHVIPTASVVASGGVATVADVSALARLEAGGVRGVVLGAALHHGAFTIAQAQAAVTV